MHHDYIDIALRWSADAERNDGSIDIALLWSAGIRFVAFYRRGISIAVYAIARTIRLLDLLIYSLDCALQGMVGSAHPTTTTNH